MNRQELPRMTTLNVNGKRVEVSASPDTPLLWALRDHLRLTGTKYGCGIAACGACTVHVDGRPTRACITPISTLAGKKVTTIEGVSGAQGDDRVARAVQQAWVEGQVPQCGYCQSGQVMAAVALLRDKPTPTDADIDDAMNGNVCRCVAYVRIRSAIKQAARSLTQQGGRA
jgi:isoquinoline 1-oxidoreductase alpha subunit